MNSKCVLLFNLKKLCFDPGVQTTSKLWSVFNRNSETTLSVIFYQHEQIPFSER